MDTAHWPQGIGVIKSMEGSRPMLERRTRPQKDQALNCPRCNSTNTKFCYYNNYSLSQPRYFCKTCRRYWTEGGSLRNVPVGGGSRKNKRSSTTSTSTSSSSSPSSAAKKLAHHLHDHQHIHHHLNPPSSTFPQSASQNPKIHHGQDLNLAYPPSDQDYDGISRFVEVPYSTTTTTTTTHDQNKSQSHHHQNPNSSISSTSSPFSAMELLKTGIIASRGLNSFINPMPVVPNSNTMFPTGFPMQEFKPSLNFGLDGFENGYGGLNGVQETSARLLFPNEELKQVSGNAATTTTTEFDQQNRGQGDSAGYWTGMLGGGSW